MDRFTNRLDALEASNIINETIVSVLPSCSAITLTSGMTTSGMNSMANSIASANLVTSSSTIFSDKGKATPNIITKNNSGDAIVNISCHGMLQNAKSQQPQLVSNAVGMSVCTEGVQSHLPGVGGVPLATAVAQGHQIASVGEVALAMPHASHIPTLPTLSVSQELNLPKSSISHQVSDSSQPHMVTPVNCSKICQDSQQTIHYGAEGTSFRIQGVYETVTMPNRSVITSTQNQLLCNHAQASQKKGVSIMPSLPIVPQLEALIVMLVILICYRDIPSRQVVHALAHLSQIYFQQLLNTSVAGPGMMGATLVSTCGTKGLQGETSLQDLRQSTSLQQ